MTIGALVFAVALALPEARAPFARSDATVRPVDFLSFDYRTGRPWRPSKSTYRWAELVSGDKSVLVAGNDRRVAGMGGDVGAGFGHLAFYAGKNERLQTGTDYLGEVRFRLKEGGPWNESWPTDRLSVDETNKTFTWTRPWAFCGTNGVFTYIVRAAGVGRMRADWNAGVDRATWDRLKLGRKMDMYLLVPQDRPAPHRTDARTWELNPSDPSKHVTVTLDESGPTGTVTADFHESTALKTPPQPKTGGFDFWLTDGYDVPPKPGRNLMTNGGFEQGWKGWRTNRAAPMAAVTNHPGVRFSELVADAHAGRRALKIDLRGEKGDLPAFMSAPLALEPGKKYTVAAWIRSDRDRKGGVALVSAPEGDMVKQTWPEKNVNTCFQADRAWKRHAVSFIASAQGTHIHLWPWGGPIWIDDVTVVEGDDAPGAEGDPVEARLASADEYNYFHVGQQRQMRLELTGRPSLAGTMRVSVLNYSQETLFARSYPFALDGHGFGEVVLPELDAADLGKGVFVVRLDYDAAGVQWRDYARFTVLAPHDGTHPLAGFFAHFPWFAGGGAYKYTVSGEHADFMATRMRELGVGATSWQPNSSYARGHWAPYYRKYGIVNKHHILQTDLSSRYPERFGWGRPGLGVFTNAAPEELSFIEAEAYRSAKEAHPSDVYWTFSNEEELWQPLVKQKKFDTYFKYQYACYKGLKRGFDERGMNFFFAPTHGTASYCHPSSYAVMDGYLEAAARQGFRYTCISVHTYHAVDGSILGAGDRDAGADHLLERLKHYGYPETTPILFPEGYNVLPMYIPDWGAKDWADVYHGTIPSQSVGLREALHAGALARIYLTDLKRYPRLKVVHPWQAKPYMDDAFTPYLYTMVMNTLGWLLPDPRFVGDARPYPDVRAYCFRPTPEAADGVLALWTSANAVEKGLRKGDVLTMTLPADATFVDLMGNARTPSAGQEPPRGWMDRLLRRPRTVKVPLTPYPLFIRSKDPQALLAAVRQATGGTAGKPVRKAPATVSVGRAGASVDWSAVQPLTLTNRVADGVRADLRLVRQGNALVCRVTVAGVPSATVDFSFDGLGDARATGLAGAGPDDCAFRVEGGCVSRLREVNTQFREGGATGRILTAEDVARDVKADVRMENGAFVCTVAFPQRHLSPVRLESEVRFGLDVAVKTAMGSAALSASDEPADYPLVILK